MQSQVRMNRSVLLVSYHFGPGCDTGGFRWNAIATHLAEAGWEVDVLTAARRGYAQAYSLVPGVSVHPINVPTWMDDAVQAVGRLKRQVLGRGRRKVSPAELDTSLLPVRQGETDPETGGTVERLYGRAMATVSAAGRWSAEVGWARKAARAGVALGAARIPSVVAVSSPPHPTQLAGVRLSSILGRPYLADFRDPWLIRQDDPVQSTLLDGRFGYPAQRRAFEAATLAVFNTARAAEAATVFDPGLIGRTATVPNGYDARENVGLPDREHFRVAFVGWLYDFMDPDALLAACARLRDRERLEVLRIEFVGTDPAPGGVELAARARRHGLESCFEHRGRVSRSEAQQIQDRAAVQVVFDAPGPLRVPSKFYDAVQCYGNPLLLGWPDSAMADAAMQLGLSVCHPADARAIDAALAGAFSRWRGGDYRAPVDERGIFARLRTSQKMLELLNALR
jgi:hypothetical protein